MSPTIWLNAKWWVDFNHKYDDAESLWQSENLGSSNYTSKLLTTETLDKEGTKEFNIKWSAASLYAGGADTVGRAYQDKSFALLITPSCRLSLL